MITTLVFVSVAALAPQAPLPSGEDAAQEVAPVKSESYVHTEPESWTSWGMKWVLRAAGMANPLGSTLDDKKFQSEADPLPDSLTEKYNVKTETFDGRTLWTIGPKGKPSDQVIFFVHGGAYVFNVVGLHWELIEFLVAETKATVVVANYPLAHQATATKSYAYMDKLYRRTLESYKGRDIVFFGDSSGGGLAIAFAQHLRDEGVQQPSQVITLSPWLDVGLSNPKIVVEDEPAMRIDELRRAGKLYAGDLSPQDPRVSPIYGDFKGVAPIACFIGTHELFVADARKLKGKLKDEGIPFRYYEYPKMIHTWALFPMIPETENARHQMVNLLKKH